MPKSQLSGPVAQGEGSSPRQQYLIAPSKSKQLAKPPFPSKQMFILAMCRICEPIAFMSIFPYIYYMVEDFHITTDPSQISIYAGMVTSAFTLAEFSTGVFWGRLSDKVGRKPILLCGLAGTGLSSLIFGFAPNLTVAIIARALGGILNGNIGVLQTTIAEIVTVKEYQPRAYTVMPMVWCFGSILGPIIGGALARPCINYPSVFPSGTIFERYPYMLPNLFGASAVLFGLVVGVLFLEETHPLYKSKHDSGRELGRKIIAWLGPVPYNPKSATSFEDDNILPGYTTNDNSPVMSFVHPLEPTEDLDLNESQPLLQNSNDKRYVETTPDETIPQPPVRTFTRPVVLNIISYGILAFHTMTFDQLLPVFLSTNPPEHPDVDLPFKFAAGFGFETKTIGLILALQGGYSMMSTLFFFPTIAKFLSPRRIFQTLALSYFLLYLVTPYIVLLPLNLRMVGVCVLVIWKCTFSTMAYPSNAILLANSAPSALSLGTINGIAASTASLCRAFGPTISGILYAAGLRTGYSGIAWWVTGAVSIIGAVISIYLPEPKGRFDDTEDEEAV